MESYDPQKAARVWQRVQAQAPVANPELELQEMIREEMLDAATYAQLFRQLQGVHREKLQKLYRDEKTHVACLKGIYTLTTGGHVSLKPLQVQPEPVQVALRRCYGREMKSLARYEARSKDPHYGQVFSRLAEQEREHCRLLLELLGSLPTVKNERVK